MLHTDREALAYDIRRDGDYAQRWMQAEAARGDHPTLPSRIGAADFYVNWCEGASDLLLTQPRLDEKEYLSAMIGAWRLHAVASGIEFIPYRGLFDALSVMWGTITLLALVLYGWPWALIVGFLGGTALLVWRSRMIPRIAVGPDARRTDLSAADLAEMYAELYGRSASGRRWPARPRWTWARR